MDISANCNFNVSITELSESIREQAQDPNCNDGGNKTSNTVGDNELLHAYFWSEAVDKTHLIYLNLINT